MNNNQKTMPMLKFIRGGSKRQNPDRGGSLQRNASWGSTMTSKTSRSRGSCCNNSCEDLRKVAGSSNRSMNNLSNHGRRRSSRLIQLAPRGSILRRLGAEDSSEASFLSDSQHSSSFRNNQRTDSAGSGTFPRNGSSGSLVFDASEIEQRRKVNADRTKRLMDQLGQQQDIQKMLQGHCLP